MVQNLLWLNSRAAFLRAFIKWKWPRKTDTAPWIFLFWLPMNICWKLFYFFLSFSSWRKDSMETQWSGVQNLSGFITVAFFTPHQECPHTFFPISNSLPVTWRYNWHCWPQPNQCAIPLQATLVHFYLFILQILLCYFPYLLTSDINRSHTHLLHLPPPLGFAG